ncbi:MAG: DegT/DnrJ/EryC1/StrS family aminotransferase [bacterium]|nr:DegT/DnrJ/EryC1/StrS family aminotransferase [bacterium]
MQVPFFDYPLQYTMHEREYQEIIIDVLRRGAYILGEDVDRFEKNLAKFLNAKYAIGVANGTDALLLALHGAGVGPGDEVITVSHTFVATVEVIVFLGATPVLIDIADDHLMNVNLIERAITSRTKAIMPVHINGRMCDHMDTLMEIAKKHHLQVIEDAAQALGASFMGRCAGTFGRAGCFSFYPAKALGTFGDAGAIVTDDEEFATRVRLLRNHGRKDGTEIHAWGLNSRIDNLHAAILDYKLTHYIPEWLGRRREVARMYNHGLSSISALRLPAPPDEGSIHYDVFQNYEMEVQDRDALARFLYEHGIRTAMPWGGKAVHQFTGLSFGPQRLINTETILARALMLPLYPELRDEQIRYVVDTIKEFYQSYSRT